MWSVCFVNLVIERSSKQYKLCNLSGLDLNPESVTNQLFSHVNFLVLKIEREILT